MAQPYTSLDEAAQQLGISKELLGELREAGKVRGYRDGASWKFKSEDIEKLAAEGIASLDSGIDLGGIAGDETLPAGGFSGDEIDLGDEDLDLGDLDLGSEPVTAKPAEVSDLDLANVDEPTTPVGPEIAAEDDLELSIEPLELENDAESILLSDADFTDPHGRPPSTIIGKVDLDKDSDLQLAPSGSKAGQSDVRLADATEDVLGSDILGSGVLDVGKSPSAKFEDLAELEIDLEAESSRILSPSDVAKAHSAAQAQQKAPASDLQLDDDFDLAGSGAGLTGISSIDVSASKTDLGPSASSASPLEMAAADDDDFVLGGEGSDITLSAADSGINLRPSDSGLALDEAPLELGGSAISSSLDLGEALSAGRSGSLAGLSDLGEAEDFQLTPFSEVPADEDEEDSSQIIALEEVSEESAEGLISPVGFEPVGGLSTAAMTGSPGVATLEVPFTIWQVVFLFLCFFLIMLCGMMMIDLMRNMWSWNQPYSLNSGLIDGILGLLGLG